MAAFTPPPSPLRDMKSRTPTHTTQLDETCKFHTLSRMIIKAVFDPLLPMTPEDLIKYESCMPLVTPVTLETLATYSEERCSENGYLKIMLFYYFFELTKLADLETIEGVELQPLLEMPPIPQIDAWIFATLKESIKNKWFGYKLELGDPSTFKKITTNLLVPLFRGGFYAELELRPYDEGEVDKDDGHFVLIVGLTEDGKLIIKNSWDEHETHVQFEEIIELEGELFAVDILHFIFPHELGEYVFESYDADVLFKFVDKHTKRGGKKRKTKYGQRRNHHQPKTIRASRKRPKTYYTRRLSKY